MCGGADTIRTLGGGTAGAGGAREACAGLTMVLAAQVGLARRRQGQFAGAPQLQHVGQAKEKAGQRLGDEQIQRGEQTGGGGVLQHVDAALPHFPGETVVLGVGGGAGHARSLSGL